MGGVVNRPQQAQQPGVVNLHGRIYKTVALRVHEFRAVHPLSDGWGIITEIVSRDDESIVMRAAVVDPKGRTLATGFAHEVRTRSGINSTSALENAETSAIGRALSACGFAGQEYASANEVENARKREPTTARRMARQEEPRTMRAEGPPPPARKPGKRLTGGITEPQKRNLERLCGSIDAGLRSGKGKARRELHAWMTAERGYPESFTDLNGQQASTLIDRADKLSQLAGWSKGGLLERLQSRVKDARTLWDAPDAWLAKGLSLAKQSGRAS